MIFSVCVNFFRQKLIEFNYKNYITQKIYIHKITIMEHEKNEGIDFRSNSCVLH